MTQAYVLWLSIVRLYDFYLFHPYITTESDSGLPSYLAFRSSSGDKMIWNSHNLLTFKNSYFAMPPAQPEDS